MNKYLSCLLYLLIFFSSSLPARGLAVSPLLIQIDVAPGKSIEFKFNVFAKNAALLNLSVLNMAQGLSGHMSYVEAPVSKRMNPASWVKLNFTRKSLKRNEDVEVVGNIKVPKNVSGTQLVTVMVEENGSDNNKGVAINIRYAVTVIMNVSSRNKMHTKLELDNIRFKKQNDRLFLAADLNNLSVSDIFVNPIIQIRDINYKLVGKLPLKSKSTWEREEQLTRVFPSSKVVVFNEMRKPLKPGNYHVTVLIKGKKKNLKVVRNDLFLKEAQLPSSMLNAAKNPPRILIINPNPIHVEVKQKQYVHVKLEASTGYNNNVTLLLDNSSKRYFKLLPEKTVLSPFKSSTIFLRGKIFKEKLNLLEHIKFVVIDDNERRHVIKVPITDKAIQENPAEMVKKKPVATMNVGEAVKSNFEENESIDLNSLNDIPTVEENEKNGGI